MEPSLEQEGRTAVKTEGAGGLGMGEGLDLEGRVGGWAREAAQSWGRLR